MFRCYDAIRTHPAPLPIGLKGVRFHVDVVYFRLFWRANQWLDSFDKPTKVADAWLDPWSSVGKEKGY